MRTMIFLLLTVVATTTLAAQTSPLNDRAGVANALAMHNQARREMGLNDLVWDATLAQHGADITAKMARNNFWGHDNADLDAKREGENLSYQPQGYAEQEARALSREVSPHVVVGLAIRSFYNEHRMCPSTSSAIGHYSQMIAPSTTKVGCGYTRDARNYQGSSSAWIISCRYTPGQSAFTCPASSRSVGPLRWDSSGSSSSSSSPQRQQTATPAPSSSSSQQRQRPVAQQPQGTQSSCYGRGACKSDRYCSRHSKKCEKRRKNNKSCETQASREGCSANDSECRMKVCRSGYLCLAQDGKCRKLVTGSSSSRSNTNSRTTNTSTRSNTNSRSSSSSSSSSSRAAAGQPCSMANCRGDVATCAAAACVTGFRCGTSPQKWTTEMDPVNPNNRCLNRYGEPWSEEETMRRLRAGQRFFFAESLVEDEPVEGDFDAPVDGSALF